MVELGTSGLNSKCGACGATAPSELGGEPPWRLRSTRIRRRRRDRHRVVLRRRRLSLGRAYEILGIHRIVLGEGNPVVAPPPLRPPERRTHRRSGGGAAVRAAPQTPAPTSSPRRGECQQGVNCEALGK